jgi:hypothetical protein
MDARLLCSSFVLWPNADGGKITDMHPDDHYIEGTLARTGCHHHPDDEHNVTSKVSPKPLRTSADISTTTTHLAETLIPTIIVRRCTLEFLMVRAIVPGRSSMLHSTTSRKSGKIKSILWSGQATMSGSNATQNVQC